MQNVADAIQKAVDALKNITGAFSTLETGLDDVADKLDSIKGSVAKGSRTKLKRALKNLGEAGATWEKVVDLARNFEENGMILEKDFSGSDEPVSETQPWRLELISANYGAVNYTNLAKILFNDGEDLRIRSIEPGFPDPWQDKPKSMSVLHQYGEEKRIFACKQDTGTHSLKFGDIELSLDYSSICNVVKPYPKPDGVPAQILAIVYGPKEVRDERVYEYCYSQLKAHQPIEWSNENLGGDTWVSHGKSGTIYYTMDDGITVKQCTGREGAKTVWNPEV